MNEQRTTMNGKPVIEIEAKTVLNLESGFKDKLLCDGPTFSAGTACAYSCTYCFVPAMMRKSSHMKGIELPHEQVVVRRRLASEILRDQLINQRTGEPKFCDPYDTRTVYASPLVDVAANLELAKETVECVKYILALTHWNVRLLSKSPLITYVAAELKKFRGLDSMKRVVYGLSTGTLDDRVARAIEPDCPLASKRVQALHRLQNEGFRTFAMVCPSLPQLDYNEFAGQMAEALRYKSCEHVWAEVINLRGESFTRTVTALQQAGLTDEATLLASVSGDGHQDEWESYALKTFYAHASTINMVNQFGKLRFLQYVTKRNIDDWTPLKSHGAILLGKLAHGQATA